MYTVIYRSGQPLFMIFIVSCSRLHCFLKVQARFVVYQHGEKKHAGKYGKYIQILFSVL